MKNSKTVEISLSEWLIRRIHSGGGVSIVADAAALFGLSRRTISRELQGMVDRGLFAAKGNTRARTYRLVTLKNFSETVRVTPETEDIVWRQKLAPLLDDLPRNVQRICQHGFTEITNNVHDHSGSDTAVVQLTRTAAHVTIMIHDQGVGIFSKIRQACHLEDTRHAIFELTKGKLTTDPKFHTGEGIFFTSRMFDHFEIYSDDLCFVCTADQGDWLFDVRDQKNISGTRVWMMISVFSKRTVEEVIDKFAVGGADYGFSKTHVPLRLAQYGKEELVSRSQAKRVFARIGERFKEVVLDFDGIPSIGQAFADEAFRIFPRQNPDVHVTHVNASWEVQRMIAHVLANVEERDKTRFESRGTANYEFGT